jgi:hypothetical protein
MLSIKSLELGEVVSIDMAPLPLGLGTISMVSFRHHISAPLYPSNRRQSGRIRDKMKLLASWESNKEISDEQIIA